MQFLLNMVQIVCNLFLICVVYFWQNIRSTLHTLRPTSKPNNPLSNPSELKFLIQYLFHLRSMSVYFFLSFADLLSIVSALLRSIIHSSIPHESEILTRLCCIYIIYTSLYKIYAHRVKSQTPCSISINKINYIILIKTFKLITHAISPVHSCI